MTVVTFAEFAPVWYELARLRRELAGREHARAWREVWLEYTRRQQEHPRP